MRVLWFQLSLYSALFESGLETSTAGQRTIVRTHCMGI